MTTLGRKRGDSRSLKLLAVLVPLLILLTPFLYFAYRNLGRSFHWRFKHGLERVTEFGGMLQNPSLDENERRLVFEAVPERMTRIYLLDLESGVH